jgi:hypothetical protein
MLRLWCVVAALIALSPGRVLADANAGGDISGNSFTVWVAEATSGGVSAPSGVVCDAWALVWQSPENGTWVMELDGVEYDLYERHCGEQQQTVWVPQVPPIDVAEVAYAEVQRSVAAPTVSFSPPQPAGGVVGVPTWLGVEPMAAVTGTASLPTLSATATAHVVAVEWRTGAHVGGDVAVVSCVPWGSVERPECVWTPRYPSVRRVTGTSDEMHHGSVTVVWEVDWVASDGSSGRFDDLRTTTGYTYRVSEIQAIGERGG